MRFTRAELLRREVQAAELGRGRVAVEPAAHGVLDRLGLLEDLLEHVVRDSRPRSTSPASKSSTWTLWLTWPWSRWITRSESAVTTASSWSAR